MTTPGERLSPEIKELVQELIDAAGAVGKWGENPHYTPRRSYDEVLDDRDAAEEALLAALGALEEDKKRLQQQVDRLRAAGSWLSNAALNLSQPEVSLTPENRQSLKRAQEYWDTALNAGVQK